MTIWAIVPVKPIQRAKSRLAKVLSRDERATLSRQLLKNTLDTLSEVTQVERTLVISRDSEVLSMHPTMKEMRESPQFEAWRKTQPEWMQGAMEKTLDSGSAKDRADIFTRFQSETGLSFSKASDKGNGDKQETDESEQELSDEKKQELENMEGIKSKQSLVSERSAEANKQDFDGAFDEAIAD